ncbi:unnamed protein product [Echinostoma caproni]|uniref:Reverse transcriptase domain-containing protein n=1 Tax=Echinostoma caproni TaxID=27848 RepID=A0A183A6M8_9TREM|nr:unnamed protein product [Echinostoma caproni]
MESIVADSLKEQLDKHDFLLPIQYEFRQKRSCAAKFADRTRRMDKTIDDGEVVDIGYLDFSKAFNRVVVANWLGYQIVTRKSRVRTAPPPPVYPSSVFPQAAFVRP